MEGTVASFPRMKAYVATVITCTRADGPEEVVGHRQKL